MKRQLWISIMLIAAMAAGLITACQPAPKAETGPIAIGALPVKGVHYVPPREDKIIQDLTLAGRITSDSSAEEIQQAMEEYRQEFAKDSISWVNPDIARMALQREEELGTTKGIQSDPVVPNVSVMIFALAVEFEQDGTPFEGTDCDGISVSFDGPIAGIIPEPPPQDNIDVWYEPEQIVDEDTREIGPLYHNITFGYEGAGMVRGYDLSGYTVQDYYDKVSGEVGRVTLEGDFYGWVQVPHDEDYYGAPVCHPEQGYEIKHDINPQQLVADAADAFNAANPDFDWSQFDQNGDQIIDTFWVIHAGEGQETGGGEQAGFSIWSHSSDLRYYADWYPYGHQVAGMDTPEDPEDDIFIGPYTMNPEKAEIGVLSEEFGHNVFGWPDLYVTDCENSVGFWSNMSAGSYGGPLAGVVPVGMPLWFRMIAWCGEDWCNWQYPMVTRDYMDPQAEITIGTLEDTPEGTVKGVRVNLPPVEEDIPNYAGEGKGAWSGSGRDMTDVQLTRELEIPEGAAGLLSFDSYWEIEEDWDYGYVQVNGELLDDVGDFFTDTNPNGNNLGVGLTGFGEGTLEFDLSAYAGETVELTLWYKLDPAVNEIGWWVDNLMLDGVLVDDFETAVEPDDFSASGWTNSDDPWWVVPSFKSYTNYYLLEFRGDTKYDSSLKLGAYVTTDLGDNYWTIERVPYNIPGGLLWYRTLKYPESYSQRGYYADPPSWGPKNKILVVDMNWQELIVESNTAAFSLNNRRAAYDAALTLQDTPPLELSQLWSGGMIYPGPFTAPGRPAVTQFNDTLGYYVGFYLELPYLYYSSNRDSSAVIPARDLYSTRIRYFDETPVYWLYGYPWAPSWFGSGNPGDDNVQLGVNIEILPMNGVAVDKAVDRGTFRFYNYSVDFTSDVKLGFSEAGEFQHTYVFTVTNVGVEMATGLELAIDLDPALTLKSASVSAVKKVDSAYLWLTLPDLEAGESVDVTVVATAPFDLGDNYFSSVWMGFDGQVERGAWWLNTEIQGNRLFIPAVVK